MSAAEIGLVARARGVATHLLSRATLESLAHAHDVNVFASDLARVSPSLDPIGEPLDVFAIERAVGRTAHRQLRILYRWQEQTPGVLEVFAATQDRRSIRALVRGAVEAASSATRLDGLLPTPTLPPLALVLLAQQASPAAVVQALLMINHPDARRLLPLVTASQVDLRAIDRATLAGFGERATLAVARSDAIAREFVRTTIDLGNVQHALLLAGEPRETESADAFVAGGRWLSAEHFAAAARADTREQARHVVAAALDHSPLAPMLPVVAGDVARMERTFLTAMLERLARAARRDPLSTAPLLRVLLLVEAQSRDIRALAWGAVFDAPASSRIQLLVTPS